MSDEDLYGRALVKLSPEDQQRAYDDLVIWGCSFIYERSDGSAVLLNPSDVRIAHYTARGREYQKPPWETKP
jgi:hypothetical protein